MVIRKLTPIKKFLFLGIFLSLSFSLAAQDIHFSQFRNAPMWLNPALTGVFDGDHRITANYRSQWGTVPVGWNTLFAVFDTKVLRTKLNNGFVGLGGIINFDEAGDSRMGTFNISVNASYTHMLTKSNWLTAGVQLGGTQRSFQTDNLRFDEQWDGDRYRPDAPTGEDFSDTNVFWGDISAGANWHFKKVGSRTSLDIGLAGHHLNKPDKSFWDDDNVLEIRTTWYGVASFEAGKAFDLILNASGSYQNPAVNHMVGLGGRFHLSQKLARELALALGFNYRFNDGFDVGDAVYPFLEVDYRSWRVGFSYDVNVSDFTNASAGNGGPELSLRYIFKPVPIIPCRTCPTYL